MSAYDKPLKPSVRFGQMEMGWLAPDGRYYRVDPPFRKGGNGHEFKAYHICTQIKASGSVLLEKWGWIRVDLKDYDIRCSHICGQSCITPQQKATLVKMRDREKNTNRQNKYNVFLKGAAVRKKDCDRSIGGGFEAIHPGTGVTYWVYE